MFVSSQNVPSTWKDYSLVVPAVSVGNVGQLTVDLLVSTMGMKKVGYFYDDSFLPVVGNNPFATESSTAAQDCQLVTAVEVYISQEHQVAVIQQRSPFVKGKRQQYLEKLMDWIKICQFQEILIITSTFAHERLDCQLEGSQMRYLVTPTMERRVGSELRGELGWTELERRAVLAGQDSDGHTDLFIPGGGIAKQLFNECEKEDLSAAVVLSFCSEGDNANDAVQLASYLNTWRKWVDLKKGFRPRPLRPWRPYMYHPHIGFYCIPTMMYKFLLRPPSFLRMKWDRGSV